MELVVDANVLLASLLKDAVTRELLLDSRLKLFAPEHFISESLHLLRSNSSLKKRIGLSGKDLEELFYLLTQEIETVPKKSYTPKMMEAIELAPHREDAPYLALALSMNIPVWSNDKGMKIQKKIKIISTSELIALLEKRAG